MTTNTELQVIVAIDDAKIRRRTVDILRECGYIPNVLESSFDLRRMAPANDFIILHTGDDVADMTQAVYELYKSCAVDYTLWVLVLLSRDALSRNRRVSTWLIDGHAAVLGVIDLDDPQSDAYIRSWAFHLRRAYLNSQKDTELS